MKIKVKTKKEIKAKAPIEFVDKYGLIEALRANMYSVREEYTRGEASWVVDAPGDISEEVNAFIENYDPVPVKKRDLKREIRTIANGLVEQIYGKHPFADIEGGLFYQDLLDQFVLNIPGLIPERSSNFSDVWDTYEMKISEIDELDTMQELNSYNVNRDWPTI